MTRARILAVRRPTNPTVTGEHVIAVQERDTVHAIIEAAYGALYDAINALEAARQAWPGLSAAATVVTTAFAAAAAAAAAAATCGTLAGLRSVPGRSRSPFRARTGRS